MSKGRSGKGRLHVSALAALVATVLMTAPPTDSPVADAAERGDLEAVRTLLREGADVNAAHGDGMTALHWAGSRGDAEMARVLTYAGAHTGARTRLGGYTPLHLATRAGHAGVTIILIDAGSRVNEPTATGATPLHLAAASGNGDLVGVLIDRGAGIDARESRWGQTPLMYAVAEGRMDAVRTLIARGADVSLATNVADFVKQAEVDGADQKRRDKILAAARAAEAEARAAQATATVADAAAAQLQSRDESSPAPAASSPAAPAAEPADPPEAVADSAAHELQSKEAEEEAVKKAAARGEPGDGKAARGATGAAASGKESDAQAEKHEDVELTGARPAAAGVAVAAEKKSEDKPAQPKPASEEPEPLSYADLVGRQGGHTALHYAAREGHLEAVEALLAAGADINQVSGGDHTSPLLAATINGNYDLAMVLLERGADPGLASDAGTTPLFATLNNRWAPKALYPQPTAFKQQRTDYLQLMAALLERGADPNVRLTRHLWYTSYNFDLLGVDFAGATPFWRAAYATDVPAMRLLIAHGADPEIPTTKPAEGRRRRGGGSDGNEDASGLPPVPFGGPAVYPIHAASGVGYGVARAGNSHRHAPGGWLPAVKYLVEELGADVNVRDHDGYSAVHHAAARGDNELILYLVEKGADVTFVSRRGQTTVDMANGPQQRVQPFPETIALLEGLGAKNNHNCQSC